jgi:hypothetical protein
MEPRYDIMPINCELHICSIRTTHKPQVSLDIWESNLGCVAQW